MPIYEFKCLNCDHDFEELCSMGSNSVKCPLCASLETKRKVSVFSAKSTGSEGTKSIASGHSCGTCHGGSCGTCH